MTDFVDDFRRVVERADDALAVFGDQLCRGMGLDDDPKFAARFLLTDEERDAIEQRAFGRTLAELDAYCAEHLPEQVPSEKARVR